MSVVVVRAGMVCGVVGACICGVGMQRPAWIPLPPLAQHHGPPLLAQVNLGAALLTPQDDFNKTASAFALTPPAQQHVTPIPRFNMRPLSNSAPFLPHAQDDFNKTATAVGNVLSFLGFGAAESSSGGVKSGSGGSKADAATPLPAARTK